MQLRFQAFLFGLDDLSLGILLPLVAFLGPIVFHQQYCDGYHENEAFADKFRTVFQGLVIFQWFDILDAIARRPNGHARREVVVGLANLDQYFLGGVKAGKVMLDAF